MNLVAPQLNLIYFYMCIEKVYEIIEWAIILLQNVWRFIFEKIKVWPIN